MKGFPGSAQAQCRGVRAPLSCFSAIYFSSSLAELTQDNARVTELLHPQIPKMG